MTSRDRMLMFGAVILVVVGFWMTLGGKVESEGLRPPQVSEPSTEDAVVPVSTSPVSSIGASDSDEAEGSEVPGPADASQSSNLWSAAALEFASLEDPNPAMSRHLHTVIEMSLHSRPEWARYDVQSVECRGYTCQILSVDQSPDIGPAWPKVVGNLLEDLGSDSIVPTMGVNVGPPLVKLVRKVRVGEHVGYITQVGLKEL